MKNVSALPDSGQFVAVWIYDGEIWSDIYKWIGGRLFKYHDDDFTELVAGIAQSLNATYFIKD